MQERDIDSCEAARELVDGYPFFRQALDVIDEFAVGIRDAVSEVYLIILELKLIFKRITIRNFAALVLQNASIIELFLLEADISNVGTALLPVPPLLRERALGKIVRRHTALIEGPWFLDIADIEFYP